MIGMAADHRGHVAWQTLSNLIATNAACRLLMEPAHLLRGAAVVVFYWRRYIGSSLADRVPCANAKLSPESRFKIQLSFFFNSECKLDLMHVLNRRVYV